jgi:hypothetical protein
MTSSTLAQTLGAVDSDLDTLRRNLPTSLVSPR